MVLSNYRFAEKYHTRSVAKQVWARMLYARRYGFHPEDQYLTNEILDLLEQIDGTELLLRETQQRVDKALNRPIVSEYITKEWQAFDLDRAEGVLVPVICLMERQMKEVSFSIAKMNCILIENKYQFAVNWATEVFQYCTRLLSEYGPVLDDLRAIVGAKLEKFC